MSPPDPAILECFELEETVNSEARVVEEAVKWLFL